MYFRYMAKISQRKRFHNQKRQKMLSESSLNPEAWNYATGINKLISHWQKCIHCNGSYFDE